MQVYKIREIDLDNIVYSKPKGNTDKRIIMIGYNDPDKDHIVPLVYQTSELYCANSIEKVSSGNVEYQLDVPVYARTEKKTVEFCEFLHKLNEKVLSDAKEHSSEWFGDIENIRYKSIIRGTNNTGNNEIFSNGTIRLKLINNPRFRTIVFDENKCIVDPTKYLVANSCYVRVMIEISALWISGNSFGIATKIYQIGTSNKINSLMSTENYAFIEDSDDEQYDELCADTEMEKPREKREHESIEESDVLDNIIINNNYDIDNKIQYLKRTMNLNDDQLNNITTEQIDQMHKDMMDINTTQNDSIQFLN